MDWKKIGIVVAFFLVLVVSLMYAKDRVQGREDYILVYDKCLKNQPLYYQDTLFLLERGELGKIEYNKRMKAIEECSGCYNGCGGCNNPTLNIGFGEWFIEKIFFSRGVICPAVCQPYCMSPPLFFPS